MRMPEQESEPMYDTVELEVIREQSTAELIAKLLLYTKSLQKQIVALRADVNRLTPQGEQAPYEGELHSDLYENFDDHPAYERYQDMIDVYLSFYDSED